MRRVLQEYGSLICSILAVAGMLFLLFRGNFVDGTGSTVTGAMSWVGKETSLQENDLTKVRDVWEIEDIYGDEGIEMFCKKEVIANQETEIGELFFAMDKKGRNYPITISKIYKAGRGQVLGTEIANVREEKLCITEEGNYFITVMPNQNKKMERVFQIFVEKGGEVL